MLGQLRPPVRTEPWHESFEGPALRAGRLLNLKNSFDCYAVVLRYVYGTESGCISSDPADDVDWFPGSSCVHASNAPE